MTKHSLTYNRFDIVVLPFPFSDDIGKNKRRPAVILSSDAFNSRSQHVIIAMIATAKKSAWPFDFTLMDLTPTGLEVPCIIRMKLFTADKKLISQKAGHLSDPDKEKLNQILRDVFHG